MKHCPNCHRTLAKASSARCEHCDSSIGADHDDPVEVLSTSEMTLVPIVKSILDGAEIPYYTLGETMMGLVPSALLPPSPFHAKPEIRFLVAADRADEAEALLTPVGEDFDVEDSP